MLFRSCGHCLPCRNGTKRMLELLIKITSGQGEPSDLDDLETLARTVKLTSMCGLGQTAPNPVLTTLRYFRDEYEAHIIDKTCPAHICLDLCSYRINADKCRGCGACVQKCPVAAISGEKKLPHLIDSELCIKCGTCRLVCRFDAVELC